MTKKIHQKIRNLER